MGEKLGEKLTKNQISAIAAIQCNNKITHVELTDAIGISTISVDNNLRKLRQLGVVKRIGSAREAGIGKWISKTETRNWLFDY